MQGGVAVAPLNGIEIIAWEITLVLSAIVLVFWVAYTLMLYHQRESGKVRHDWWISMVFYVGIVLLVLGNLLLAYSQLYTAPLGTTISLVLNVVSMLIFVFAFYLRMEHALHPREVTRAIDNPKPRARRKR